MIIVIKLTLIHAIYSTVSMHTIKFIVEFRFLS